MTSHPNTNTLQLGAPQPCAQGSSPSRLAALSSTLVVGMPPTVATAAAALSPGPPSHSSLPEATLFSPGRSFEACAALASFSGLVRRRPCMFSRCSSTSQVQRTTDGNAGSS